MRVLQVLPALELGGVERGCVDLACALVRRGHDSFVVSAGGRLVAQLEREGSRHFELPIERKHVLGLLQIRALRRLLRDIQPDIVHVRSRWPAWLMRFARDRLPKAERPHLVSTAHGFYSVNRYSAIMTSACRVIAPSEVMRDYLLTNYPRLDPERIRVIHRGLNPDEFPPDTPPVDLAKHCPTPVLAQNPAVLVISGRLVRGKGQHLFIRLIGALRDSKPERPVLGIILGAGKAHYTEELRRLIERLNLGEHVHLMGTQSQVAAWYARADAVCSLSIRPETFGRTVAEALALSRPVIALAHGGVTEILKASFPEGLVPLQTDEDAQVAALAEKTRAVLEAAPRPQLAAAFYLDRQVERTLAVYRELINN